MDVEKAVAFAAMQHKGQKRKGTDMPYIVHPIEAAAIAARLTDDKDVICAAALHDVLEDTEITDAEFELAVGKRVFKIVNRVSNGKRKNKKDERPWRESKAVTVAEIKTMNADEMIVELADKLANMRSIYADYKKVGEALWARFNAGGKDDMKWYYEGLCEALKPMAQTDEWQELNEKCKYVFE